MTYQLKKSTSAESLALGNSERLTLNELFDLAAQLQANKAVMDLINYHVDKCGPFHLTTDYFEVSLQK